MNATPLFVAALVFKALHGSSSPLSSMLDASPLSTPDLPAQLGSLRSTAASLMEGTFTAAAELPVWARLSRPHIAL